MIRGKARATWRFGKRESQAEAKASGKGLRQSNASHSWEQEAERGGEVEGLQRSVGMGARRKALPVTQGEAGARTKGEGRVPSRGGTEPNFFLTGPHLLQVENQQGGTCNRPERDDGHLDQGGRGQGR